MEKWRSRLKFLDLSLLDEDLSGKLRKLACDLLAAIEEDRAAPRVPDDFTNGSVLGHESAAYPKTLHEYALEEVEAWWLYLNAEKERKFRDCFINIRNFAFLNQTKHGFEYHSRLPPLHPNPAFHNVWLVCKPFSSNVEAFRHWSVYTQGHNIHLTADKRTRATGLAAQNFSQTVFLQKVLADGKSSAKIDLKWRDLSSPNTSDYRKLLYRTKQPRFVAYNVGRTTYTPDQIENLSEAIIERMREKGTYHLFENNCQHFVISLIRRLVMTQREPKAVGGTLLEIADWDQSRPNLHLVPWLTRTKRFFLLKQSGSRDKPVSRRSLTSPSSLDRNTWAHMLHAGFFKLTWLEAPLKVLASENRRQEASTQYNQHVKHHVGWLGENKNKPLAFLQMVLWAGTWLGRNKARLEAATVVSAAATGAAAASFALPGAAAALGTGFLLYLFIGRTLYPRGSSNPVHYDIKRTGPPISSAPTSSTDSDDSGGHITDSYTPSVDSEVRILDDDELRLIEEQLNDANEMFLPRSQPVHYGSLPGQSIPSFAFTPTVEDSNARSEVTSPYYSGEMGIAPMFPSRSSSPERSAFARSLSQPPPTRRYTMNPEPASRPWISTSLENRAENDNAPSFQIKSSSPSLWAPTATPNQAPPLVRRRTASPLPPPTSWNSSNTPVRPRSSSSLHNSMDTFSSTALMFTPPPMTLLSAYPAPVEVGLAGFKLPPPPVPLPLCYPQYLQVPPKGRRSHSY